LCHHEPSKKCSKNPFFLHTPFPWDENARREALEPSGTRKGGTKMAPGLKKNSKNQLVFGLGGSAE
jgi:hypothetical protein